MLFCGSTFAMATGGHGGGGGSTGGGGSSTTEKDGSPGPDRDAAAEAERSANAAALAECERLVRQQQIGQDGPASGSEVSVVGRDCDMPTIN
jgi:hypothetical protein